MAPCVCERSHKKDDVFQHTRKLLLKARQAGGRVDTRVFEDVPMCGWEFGLVGGASPSPPARTGFRFGQSAVAPPCVSGVIACVRFTRQARGGGGVSAAAAPGSRRYGPSLQSLLANSCFILWQFALMKSRRSSSDLCSLSIFNHVILIWGMS